MKKHFLFFSAVLCSFATFSQAPKYSNEFLAIGVGARAFGMSQSQAALCNDVTSGYWNPSGLTGVKSNLQISLMHSELYAGIAKYDYAALAAPVDATSAAGFSFIRFGVDDIADTSELIDADGNINYDRVKLFSAADYAFVFSYAKRTDFFFLKNLAYGLNAKVIHRKVGDYANAWGFGLDFGIQYDYKGWKLGIMGKDITTTFNAWKFSYTDALIAAYARTGNSLPQNSLEITLPRFVFGLARNFNLPKKFTLLPELDVDITSDGKRNVLIAAHTFSADPHAGLEAGYANLIFLRAGIGNIQRIRSMDGEKQLVMQPNMGLGVKIKRVSLDYALTNLGKQSNTLYSNVFSLRLDVNKRESAMQ